MVLVDRRATDAQNRRVEMKIKTNLRAGSGSAVDTSVSSSVNSGGVNAGGAGGGGAGGGGKPTTVVIYSGLGGVGRCVGI
jgi:hypothetical protein